MTKQEFLRKFDSKEKFTEKEIKNLIFYDDVNEVDRIEEEKERWTQSIAVIIEINGRYFKLRYDEGLTEMQANIYYTDVVEVKPVKKTIIITEWNPMK